jgi:hypothetical protein
LFKKHTPGGVLSMNVYRNGNQEENYSQNQYFRIKKRRAIKELPFYQNIMTKTTTSHLNQIL